MNSKSVKLFLSGVMMLATNVAMAASYDTSELYKELNSSGGVLFCNSGAGKFMISSTVGGGFKMDALVYGLSTKRISDVACEDSDLEVVCDFGMGKAVVVDASQAVLNDDTSDSPGNTGKKLQIAGVVKAGFMSEVEQVICTIDKN